MDRNGRVRMGFGWLRLVTLAVVACLVVSGCRHRRSSLRPVYMEPGPVYVETTPETVVPGAIDVEPPLGSTSGDESLPTPRYEDDFGGAVADPIVVSPPAAPGPEAEPELEPAPAPRDDATIPSRVGDEPAITPPQSFRAKPRAGATQLTSERSLRQMVQERADDPLDLVQPPKADRGWRYIAIHHSGAEAGGYAQLDRQHRSSGGLNGCGYHFVIGNGTDSADGTIEVTRRWSEQKPSQHCRDATDPAVNDYGIAICLVGDFEKQEPTARQLESARLLVRYLSERYGIDEGRVATHAELGNGDASQAPCPGRNLRGSELLDRPALSRR